MKGLAYPPFPGRHAIHGSNRAIWRVLRAIDVESDVTDSEPPGL